MNKSTRKLRQNIAQASRAKQIEVEHKTPVRDYHNKDKVELVTVKFPTAVPNKDGLVSSNPRRNTAMRVYVNTDAKGKSFSITRHEPLNEKAPITFKNHGYVKGYRQPANIR